MQGMRMTSSIKFYLWLKPRESRYHSYFWYLCVVLCCCGNIALCRRRADTRVSTADGKLTLGLIVWRQRTKCQRNEGGQGRRAKGGSDTGSVGRRLAGGQLS